MVFDYEVYGTSTRIRFTTLPDKYYIVAPDVWMTLSRGLFSMTKSIAARGGKALAGNDELDYDSESSDLMMKHSDQGPGAMKLTVFSDLLYGIGQVVYSHGLHVEVKLDVWDGRLHVGTGWLLNKDHPQARNGKRDFRQLERDCRKGSRLFGMNFF